jgi:flagellar hook assembly protein FlgD
MKLPCRFLCAAMLLALAAAVAHGQSLSISPQQVYVLECQETFVTLTGTDLTGTASTLVDFSGSSGLFELEPSTATSTQLVVWIPLGVAYAVGDYSVTVKATDTNNATRTIGPVTLSVIQRSTSAPPVLSLPEVVTAETTSSSGTVVTYDAGGAGCSPASGSLFPVGTTTVSCSMSNGFGTTTGTFSVVVTNTAGSAPTFSLPEVIIAEATSAAGAAVTFNASPATCDHTSGATYPFGDTTVTCSATNSFGTTTAVMTIAVLDTMPPILNLPASFTTGNNVVTYTATATDAVDGAVSPGCSPPSGSSFPNGATVVTCTAADSRGNSSAGSFTVTVVPPQLSDFTASQNVFQLNAAASGTVTYTSNVPMTLTETITIRSEATGQTVRTLFSGVRAAGSYQDVWNGTNDGGQLVGDGAYRYFIVVSANNQTFTWDDGTHYMGSTVTQYNYPMCRKDENTFVACTDSSLLFDPYLLKPLRIGFCAASGDPAPPGVGCTVGNTPFVMYGKAVFGAETDSDCHGSDCFLSEYRPSGQNEFSWYGTSIDGTYLADAPYLTIIRRNDVWPRNLTLVYGTSPTLSGLSITPLIFNPAGPTSLTIQLNASTYQARTLTAKAAFRNVMSLSVLRTVPIASQGSGQIVLTWNGRAENGAWVAPGLYEVTITVTDSAGGSATLKPLITVRYE